MSRCDTYAWGNCTAGACSENAWVPDDLGDGGDWAVDAGTRGFEITMIPTIGSVVCYCRGDGYSPFGHVATVVDVRADGTFQVHEENYIGLGQWDYRWSSLYDVCGFILPPGVSPGAAPSGLGRGAAVNASGLPWAPIQAWDDVRAWTHLLGAELYARGLNVARVSDLLEP